LQPLTVVILVAGLCGLALLVRSFPRDWVRPTRPYEELAAALRGQVEFARGLTVAVIAVTAIALTLGFGAVERLIWRPVPEAVFVLLPARFLFTTPGLFIGAATGGLLAPHIHRQILKGRYWDGWFVGYRRRHPRSPAPAAREYLRERRLITLSTPIVAVIGLIVACLLLDAHAYLTPSEIVVKPFGGFRERRHTYADVESMNTRLASKHRLECRIAFKDGATFSTEAPPTTLTNREVDALATYVFERTGVPWTHDP
jgi:hypothetical protein